MKRLFGFLLVFVVFFSFSLNSVHGQGSDLGPNSSASGEFSGYQPVMNTVGGTTGTVDGNKTANEKIAKDEEEKGKACFSMTRFSMAECVSGFFQNLIKGTLIQIAGFFLWITSNMFSYSVEVGILNFKMWASDALYPLWSLVRQIISLLVVFIGLYLGFRYILGQDEKFARYLPFVVMFALFINFSYPIARFAVDVSNIVSLNIYTAAFSNEALNGQSNASAGAVIMNRLGLGSLVLGATYVEKAEAASGNLIKGINTVPAALLVVIFILYAAYVFFMATALMVMRTAALVFIIVASPLLLVDSILPVLGDKAQQLRKIFFEQLAVGPVFMLMIALTTKFLVVFSEGPLSKGVDSTVGGDKSGVIVFFNVLMMIVMLHIALKISRSVSGTLGEYATSAIGKVGGVALGAATGGTGLLARNSLGRLAMKARDSKWVTNNQNTAMGRRLYDMSNTLANSSYDLRNSSVVAGGMQKAGLNMGKGRTAGYEQAMEDRRKDILARGARIKTRYERDVVDDAGNIIHKKGDIDTEGEAAARRYLDTNGGALFGNNVMTKDMKDKLSDDLTKQLTEKNSEIRKEEDSKASEIVEKFKSLKTSKEREEFVENLNEKLNLAEESYGKKMGIEAVSINKAFEKLGIKLPEKKPDFDLSTIPPVIADTDWSTYETSPTSRGTGTASVDPSVISATQKARYEAAVNVAQEQMDNGGKGGEVDPSQASTPVPSNGKGGGGGASATPPVPVNGGGATATHNPTTDDAAAQVTALLARIKTNEETSRQQAATVIANAQASSKVSLQNNQTPPSSS